MNIFYPWITDILSFIGPLADLDSDDSSHILDYLIFNENYLDSSFKF